MVTLTQIVRPQKKTSYISMEMGIKITNCAGPGSPKPYLRTMLLDHPLKGKIYHLEHRESLCLFAMFILIWTEKTKTSKNMMTLKTRLK